MDMDDEPKPRDPGFVETMREMLAREPFEPFRITMTSGDKYIIEAPQNMVFGLTRIIYCFPASDRTVYIRPNQIVALEEFFEVETVGVRKKP